MGEQADIYKPITARIIEQMETASAARWHKPWLTTGQNTLQPVNAATRREFRGLNVLMLRASAEITGTRTGAGPTSSSVSRSALRCAGVTRERRWSCARSCSVEALSQLQGGLISGQFKGAGAEATEGGTCLLAKTSTVFNAAQVDGDTPPRSARAAGTGGAAGERRALCSCHRGGGRPWIAGIGPTTSPLKAVSSCPRRCSFAAARAYYAKALHGLTHWSGRKSRLDRDLKGRYRCAGLRLRVGGLCRRRTGGGDRCGLPVRQGRGDGGASVRSRPLPQELDRCDRRGDDRRRRSPETIARDDRQRRSPETIAGEDYGALVRLASTGALVKVNGAEVTKVNQSRVRMKLELLERQQHSPMIEMVAVEQ